MSSCRYHLCRNDLKNFKIIFKCPLCPDGKYCSKKCQILDWNFLHNKTCCKQNTPSTDNNYDKLIGAKLTLTFEQRKNSTLIDNVNIIGNLKLKIYKIESESTDKILTHRSNKNNLLYVVVPVGTPQSRLDQTVKNIIKKARNIPPLYVNIASYEDILERYERGEIIKLDGSVINYISIGTDISLKKLLTIYLCIILSNPSRYYEIWETLFGIIEKNTFYGTLYSIFPEDDTLLQEYNKRKELDGDELITKDNIIKFILNNSMTDLNNFNKGFMDLVIDKLNFKSGNRFSFSDINTKNSLEAKLKGLKIIKNQTIDNSQTKTRNIYIINEEESLKNIFNYGSDTDNYVNFNEALKILLKNTLNQDIVPELLNLSYIGLTFEQFKAYGYEIIQVINITDQTHFIDGKTLTYYYTNNNDNDKFGKAYTSIFSELNYHLKTNFVPSNNNSYQSQLFYLWCLPEFQLLLKYIFDYEIVYEARFSNYRKILGKSFFSKIFRLYLSSKPKRISSWTGVLGDNIDITTMEPPGKKGGLMEFAKKFSALMTYLEKKNLDAVSYVMGLMVMFHLAMFSTVSPITPDNFNELKSDITKSITSYINGEMYLDFYPNNFKSLYKTISEIGKKSIFMRRYLQLFLFNGIQLSSSVSILNRIKYYYKNDPNDKTDKQLIINSRFDPDFVFPFIYNTLYIDDTINKNINNRRNDIVSNLLCYNVNFNDDNSNINSFRGFTYCYTINFTNCNLDKLDNLFEDLIKLFKYQNKDDSVTYSNTELQKIKTNDKIYDTKLQVERLKTLIIYNCKIKTLPLYFLKCENLQFISLTGNKLKDISEDILNLNLQMLHIDNNEFEDPLKVFKLLTNLTTLKVLFFGENSLETIPDEIIKLSNLRTLELAGNNIKTITNNFIPTNFVSMRTLYLAGNKTPFTPQLKTILDLFKTNGVNVNYESTIKKTINTKKLRNFIKPKYM